MNPFKLVGRRGERGFTLIEIMVAMGLIAVVTTGAVSLIGFINKGNKTADQGIQVAGLLNSINLVLSDRDVCAEAFKAYVLNTTNGGITDLAGGIQVNSMKLIEKEPVSYNGLKVTKLELVTDAAVGGAFAEQVSAGPPAVMHMFQKYNVGIRIRMVKDGTIEGNAAGSKPTSLGAQIIEPKLIPAVLVVDTQAPSPNQVVRCVTPPTTEKEICDLLGGIYGSAGEPRCQFQKFAVSDTASDFNDSAKYYPVPDKGIYVQKGFRSDGPIKISGAPNPVLDVTGNSLLTGNLTVLGNSTFTGNMTMTGNPSFTGNMTVSGGINVSGGPGTITATGDITSTSDLRLKQNVRVADDSLARVLRLNGVRYEWRDHRRGDGDHLGLVAQDVEQVFPEVVATGADGMKSVAYGNLVAALIEAIKAQQREIVELQKTVRARAKTER
jgi:prepilin-type N-terminal cleavage/methylation domain-containing protein